GIGVDGGEVDAEPRETRDRAGHRRVNIEELHIEKDALPRRAQLLDQAEAAGKDELHADLVEGHFSAEGADDIARLGERGNVEGDDQAVARIARRQFRAHAQSFRSATSTMAWSGPLRRIRSARGRVGRMFWRRLTRLMRSHSPSATISASSSEIAAYLWK